MNKFSILASDLSSVFQASGFTINWKRGKTEAMIVFEGHGAKAASDALYKEDGSKSIAVPASVNPEGIVHVVDQ
eukprot:12011648-Karenia_brevis.AAC.1